jgi:hypothetical protein
MRKLTHISHITAVLLLAARLCQAECIPGHSPSQPNQDALALLLKTQDRCPVTTPDFLNLVERSGAKLETTMVNFLGFHDPDPGALFLFQIISGRLAGPNLSVERGDLLFGHFLTANDRSQLVLDDGVLLVEAIAWDPTKQLFNFYELTKAKDKDCKQPGAHWCYRGDSRVILEDIEFLHRPRDAGQKAFQNRLRCSGCHVNGGLVQKELAAPHNDWFVTSHKLPPGNLTPDATVAKIFQGLVDADELTKLVQASSRRLAASPEYRKALQSRTMQEQLRPLFCAVELNIESDREPFDQQKPAVQIPAGFFVDPRLGASSITIPRENYEQALKKLRSQMPEKPVPTDADHAWLTPVKADSDVVMIEALVQTGVVDNEFAADVLAVDFTEPLFSASRCRLLGLVPAGGPNFLTRFEANLKASAEPAAEQLLDNLTDPKRDAKFHRQQAADYLNACSKRAAKPEAAVDWFGVLVQRRAEVDREELSQHPRGHILESPERVVFPSASAPSGRVGLTSTCEARSQ